LLDLLLALLRGDASLLAVAARLDAASRGEPRPFGGRADQLRDAQPGEAREEAQASRERGDQHPRGAGESEGGREPGRERVAERAAGGEPERRREAVEAHRLEGGARGEGDREAQERDRNRPPAQALPGFHSPVEPEDAEERQRDPPPRRKPEQ